MTDSSTTHWCSGKTGT